MNAEMLRKVADRLENLSDPTEYDQETFGDWSCGSAGCVAWHAAEVAGVLGEASRPRRRGRPGIPTIGDLARSALGLSAREAARLFCGAPGAELCFGECCETAWPEPFAYRWKEVDARHEAAIYGPCSGPGEVRAALGARAAGRLEIAVALLRALAAGEVEL